MENWPITCIVVLKKGQWFSPGRLFGTIWTSQMTFNEALWADPANSTLGVCLTPPVIPQLD